MSTSIVETALRPAQLDGAAARASPGRLTWRTIGKEMAPSDVEVVRRSLAAFNAGDLDALVACMSPEVVWEEGPIVFPDLPAFYRGRDGVRRWYGEAIGDSWSEFRAEVLDIRDEGDGRVVQEYRLRARGRGSGVKVDTRVRQTMIVRDGLIAHRRIERF